MIQLAANIDLIVEWALGPDRDHAADLTGCRNAGPRTIVDWDNRAQNAIGACCRLGARADVIAHGLNRNGLKDRLQYWASQKTMQPPLRL
jgi:hypothetical protein